MSDISGNLKLTVVEAHLTHNTDVNKMDPYVVIQVREQEFKTKVKQEAGKEPKWNESFNIDVKYIGDDMTVKVMDDDIGKDDSIGVAKIKLSSFCVNGGFDEWYEISFKGKPAGKIHLSSVWRPNTLVRQSIKISTALQQLEHAKRDAVAKDDYLLAHKIQLRIKEKQQKEMQDVLF